MRLDIYVFIIIIALASAAETVKKQQNIFLLNNEIKLINKNENITLKCPDDDEIIKNNKLNKKLQQQDYLIKWFKNEENLKLFNKNNKIRVINNNYLLIKNFNVYDIGLYKCLIINGNGISKTFNITLKVNLTNKEINELLFNYDASIVKDGDDDEEYMTDDVAANSNSYDYYSMRGAGMFFKLIFKIKLILNFFFLRSSNVYRFRQSC